MPNQMTQSLNTVDDNKLNTFIGQMSDLGKHGTYFSPRTKACLLHNGCMWRKSKPDKALHATHVASVDLIGDTSG